MPVSRLLIGAAAAAALWLALCVGLAAVARRLPPGLLRDAVELLPACARTARALLRDARTPARVKLAVLIGVAWLLSPVDLVPDFIPLLGLADDLVVALLLLRFAARRVPADVLRDAWPAQPALLARVIGRPAPTPRG